MKNKITHLSILAAIVIGSIFMCSSHKNSHRENVAYLYRHESLKLHPVYKVYHESDEVSNVFYQINLTEFEYKPTKRGTQIAKYQIQYMLFDDYKTKRIIDSNSIILYDSVNYNMNRSNIGVFNVGFNDMIMKVSEDSIFVLKILLKDLNSDNTATYMVDIDKKDKFGRQNFYLKAKDGFPIMTDYVSRDQEFFIISNNVNNPVLKGKRFRGFFPAASAPHMGKKKTVSKRIADSTFKIQMVNGISPLIKLKKQAYYHFYNDSSRQKGLTIFRHTSQYPYIISPMQMLMPMRYITSTKEFRALLSTKDKEKGVKAFWKEIGDTPNRTKELMADYYSLVTQANFLFGSDREGWKTDRGMVYIVYGPPNIVYKNGNKETWIYGNIESKLAVTFDFYKVHSPFTNNDYWLNRSTSHSQSWYNAVDIWRR